MKKVFFAVIFLITIALTLGNIYALPQMMKGKEIYERKCARCHGKDGSLKKRGASDLQESDLSDAAMNKIITQGKKKMPAFGEKLSAQEIQEVAAYTKGLRK